MHATTTSKRAARALSRRRSRAITAAVLASVTCIATLGPFPAHAAASDALHAVEMRLNDACAPGQHLLGGGGGAHIHDVRTSRPVWGRWEFYEFGEDLYPFGMSLCATLGEGATTYIAEGADRLREEPAVGTATARCEVGDIVVNGGHHVFESHRRLAASHPTDRGWVVESMHGGTASAVCMRRGTLFERTYVPRPVMVSDETGGFGIARCTSGDVPIAGGWSTSVHEAVLGSFPVHGGWAVRTAVNATAMAYALCAELGPAIRHAYVTSGPTDSHTKAECAPGYFVLNGGADGAHEVFRSYPESTRAWHVSTGVGPLTPWAVCLRPATPTLSVGNVTVDEGDSGVSYARVPIRLSKPAFDAVTFSWRVHAGPHQDDGLSPDAVWASEGSDFWGASGTSTIPVGSSGIHLEVGILGDVEDEAHEVLFVTVDTVADATITDPTGVVTILDADLPTVIETYPPDGARDVSMFATPSAAFLQPVQTATISVTGPLGVPVLGTSTCPAPCRRVTFAPLGAFAPRVRYDATMRATNEVGEQTLRWSFETTVG